MKVIILGTGCKKCQTLEAKVRNLVEVNGINADVEKVGEIDEMLKYGIMMTPGLVIDGEVKSVGIVPKEEQLLNWLKGA